MNYRFARATSLIATFTVLSAIFFNSHAQEQKKPTPEEKAYKFRTSLFQTFSWKFGQLVGAKVKGDEAEFAKNANDLAFLASMLEEGFQIKDSLPEGTTAKANIWEDFDDFSAKAENLRKAAKGLTDAGAMADFNPREFGSKSCGSCHREYRIKQDG